MQYSKRTSANKVSPIIQKLIYGIYHSCTAVFTITLRSFVISFVRSFVCWFVRLFARSNVRSVIRSSNPSFVFRSSVRPFVPFFVRFFVPNRPFVLEFIYIFVCSLVRPVIRVLISTILHPSLFANDDALCPPARHKGRGKHHTSRPRVLGLTTEQCEGFGGSCSTSLDCDLSSNVFHGRCDNSTSGCCISKDDVCASRNGTCMSSADCEADSSSHASRLGCSSDDVVCCVANGRRAGHGGHHGGHRQGQ